MIGQLINNRYQLEKLLGRGGMGSVYRALDQLENRTVALKVLHFFLESDSEVALTRFYREFRVLARLDHPRIVRAHQYGMHEGMPYLVMEYLDGQPLSEKVAAGPLPRGLLLAIARQICEALIYLYHHAIVHRDLKPGNVMLLWIDDNPTVKLMDFGLVRAADLSRQLTQEGVALGTVAYMAPEQAQALPVDFRADLYALGVILYEMTTGRTPFIHQNPAMMLMQQLTQPLPSPRQFNPNLDEPLEQLIMHLLAREPARRPASPEWVDAQLARLADETAPLITPAAKRADVIPRVPLIDREAVLNELLHIWGYAASGQGQVVWLAGVIGLGKNRLLAEVALQARLTRESFLTGHCREHASLPYQPLIEVLEGLVRYLTPVQREALPYELARLLPGPMSITPSNQGNGDQTEARLRLFTAYWKFWQQVAQGQPRLIVIDNVHWADPTTLELLGYLAEQVKQSHIMLVLTYQPEEVEPRAPLFILQRDLQAASHVRTFTLEPLTYDQVADFLRAAMGQTHLPAWMVESFYQATGGNPLFIEETLKALAAEGQIEFGSIEPLSRRTSLPGQILQLPQNVLALAERRLQLLTTEDRAVLTAGAVLGPEFSFTLLAQVTQLDEDTLLDTIDRLLVARLIVELPLQSGEDQYRFTQEALRQALLNTVSQRRLRSLHRRAGEALESLYGPGQPRYWPALAFHWSRAEVSTKAINYLQKAGNAAARVYANLEAIAYYRQALSLLAQLQPEEGKMTLASQPLSQLYTRLGRALELESRFDEALATYTEMETVARQRDDQVVLLAALLHQGQLRSTRTPLFNQVQGKMLAEQARQLARELDDRVAEARIYWNLLNLHNYINQLDQAIEYGECSLALARELDLREQIAFTLNDVARSYWFSGQVDRTWEYYEEASRLWRELDNRPMLADSLSSLVGPAIFLGLYDKAIALADEALQVSTSIGNVWGQSYSQLFIGQVYWERGEPERAIAIMQESIGLAQQVNSIVPQVITRSDLAAVYGGLGQIDLGLETAQQALAVAEQHVLHLSIYPRAVLLQLHLLRGDLAGAEAVMAKIPVNRGKVVTIYQVLAYLTETELALARSNYDEALVLAETSLKLLHQLKILSYESRLLDIQGQALLAVGRSEEAIACWQEACKQAEALGARTRLWPLLLKLSQLETDLAEANRLRQQAREIVRYIAARLGSPELQDAFLNLPDVQTALAEPEQPSGLYSAAF